MRVARWEITLAAMLCSLLTAPEVAAQAGTYAFFSIPGKKEWTLILNKNYNQHLADDYTEKEDVVRVVVKAQTVKNAIQRLTYTIDVKEGSASGSISLMWEKVKVSLPVKSL